MAEQMVARYTNIHCCGSNRDFKNEVNYLIVCKYTIRKTQISYRPLSIFNRNRFFLKQLRMKTSVSMTFGSAVQMYMMWSETIKDAALWTNNHVQHTSYIEQSVLLKLQHYEVPFVSSYGTAGCCVSSTRIFFSNACSHFRKSWNVIIRSQSTFIYKHC